MINKFKVNDWIIQILGFNKCITVKLNEQIYEIAPGIIAKRADNKILIFEERQNIFNLHELKNLIWNWNKVKIIKIER